MSAAPSTWNAGTVKTALADFVARMTREGGRDFVPPAERIVVVENDGALWCQMPRAGLSPT